MKEISGAKVDGFNPATGSGAERAGLQAGDIIITADGNPVDRVSTLQRIVRNHAPGEKVQLEVMRYGQKKSFSVTLTELAETSRVTPASNASTPDRPAVGTVANKDLGISMQNLPAELAQRSSVAPNRRGVLVTDVIALGPAYQKLASGQDVIFEVLYPGPRRPIRTVSELQEVLGKLKTGDYISLNVHSLSQGGGDRVVNIRVGG
jgi:serine protease Do